MNTAKYPLMNPKIDFAFKKIFSDNSIEGKTALISLLNAILVPEGNKTITEIVYLNPFSEGNYPEEKQSIMDIKVKTQNNEEIDIEMQINDVDNYRKRSLYYLTKLYASQLLKSEEYADLKKCIVINILDFNLLKETEEYHSMFRMIDKRKNFELIDDLELHYVELRKFNENDKHNLDALERWIMFLSNASNQDKHSLIESIRQEEEGIDMAMKVLERISQDELERVKYEDRQKWLMDLKSSSAYMRRKGHDEGYGEGYDKGHDEGYGEGYDKGYDKGYDSGVDITAKNERKSFAKKLIAKGMSIQEIVELTGLTIDEVEHMI